MLKVIILALSLCVAANAFATGGWSAGSISEVEEIARWSTKQMSSMSGFEGEYTIQTPKNVQKQVVAGINYKFQLDVVHRDVNGVFTFKTCDMFVFEQSWTQTKKFVEAPVCRANPTQFAGAWTPVTEVTQEIVEVARMTAKQFDAQTHQLTGVAVESQVVKVFNVQRQLVNGMNYKYTAQYIVSSNGQQQTRECDMHINHQAWNNNKITFLSAPVCRATQKSGPVTGGWTQQTTVSEEVMSLAKWSTSQLSQFTGIQGEHTVMYVRNLQTQVVAGINYKFTLDVLVNDAVTGKYSFKSCDMFIYKSFDNSQKMVESPKCGPHPNFQ